MVAIRLDPRRCRFVCALVIELGIIAPKGLARYGEHFGNQRDQAGAARVTVLRQHRGLGQRPGIRAPFCSIATFARSFPTVVTPATVRIKANRKTTMHFDNEEGARTPLASGGQAFVGGDLAKSVMYQRITSDDEASRMPPAYMGYAKLSAA